MKKEKHIYNNNSNAGTLTNEILKYPVELTKDVVNYHTLFAKELKKYSLTEKALVFFDILVGIMILIGAQRLILTSFGKASMTFGITMLGIITTFRILKVWGPKEY